MVVPEVPELELLPVPVSGGGLRVPLALAAKDRVNRVSTANLVNVFMLFPF